MADGGISDVTKAVAAQTSHDEVMRWFDELRDPLRRYLICAGASATDADDAVQESFLRLYRHLEKRGDRSNLYGWVFQVARNYLRDERKSARHQRTVQLDGETTRHSDPVSSPENSLLDAERNRRLQAAIGKLPEQQRECMLLRASGLRYREIAEVMGLNTASVGSLLQRAVVRLSEDLS